MIVNDKTLSKLKNEIKIIGMLKENVSNQNGILLNAYISGSHLYGFNSKNSDIDIRGCYILDKRIILGLRRPKEFIKIKTDCDEELDIVLFEIKKLINLAVQGNCNILEEMNAPQFYYNADFVKLRQLINNSFGKHGIYNSYRGMATQNYKKFILQGRNTVKKICISLIISTEFLLVVLLVSP